MQTIFDAARDCIFVKDVDLRYVHVNKAFCQLWNVSESDCHGRTATEIFGEELGGRAREEDERVLAGEVAEEESEVEISGLLHTFSSIKVPLRDPVDDRVVGLCGIVRDITARKWAEDALRRSERRISTLMNNLPGMVYRCRNDREWTMEFVSHGCEALTGYKAEELIESATVAYGDIVHDDDQERVWDVVQEGLAAGWTFEMEYRIVKKSGEIRWVAERGVGVSEGDGQLVIEGFIADITRRVQADDALRNMLELEGFVARIASGFVSTELEQLDDVFMRALERVARFADVDRAYLVTFQEPRDSLNIGYAWCREGVESPADLLQGRPASDFSWWRQRLGSDQPVIVNDTSQAPPEAALEAGYWQESGARSVLGIGLRHERSLFGYIVFHSVREARAWREKDVALLRAVGPIFVNAIVRGRIEADKKALEDQLRHSQKIEAIGRLAGGVAHDFNNVLTAITGYAELAREMATGGEAPVEEIDEIVKAARRATSLTQQLLAFSRNRKTEVRPLLVNDMILQAEKLLSRLIGEDVSLEIDLEPDVRLVTADPSQFDQLLLNLAVNARDAMPQGGRLGISTRNVELDEEFCSRRDDIVPGLYVLLQVEDDGEGMDEKTLARVFDPFFTTKAPGKGTGLGLATVYGIVRQAGGTVDVESAPGCGATFRIYLPAELGSYHVPAGRTRAEDGPVNGNETILVVEDDAAVRSLARQVLESSGYRVLVAEHGQQALEMCQAGDVRIDLVVSDIVMPVMNGRELSDTLRVKHPQVKILLTSGYDPGQRAPEPRPTEAFLPKPFEGRDLLRAVRDVLDDRTG